MEEEESKKGPSFIIILLVGLAAGSVAYWKFFRTSPPPAPEAVAPAATQAPAQPAQNAAAPPLNSALGEELLRAKAHSLGADPRLSDWLKNENIIRRIAVATAIIADGKNPKDSLAFLKPSKPFAAVAKNGKLYIDPKSYARYDPTADVIASLSAEAAVKIFRELRPLFQEAYDELGEPSRDFQDVLGKAIGGLLQVPANQGDIQLKEKVVSYAMADEKLEKMSSAQKHLLRMGPRNIAKIQDKLREISRALAAPAK